MRYVTNTSGYSWDFKFLTYVLMLCFVVEINLPTCYYIRLQNHWTCLIRCHFFAGISRRSHSLASTFQVEKWVFFGGHAAGGSYRDPVLGNRTSKSEETTVVAGTVLILGVLSSHQRLSPLPTSRCHCLKVCSLPASTNILEITLFSDLGFHLFPALLLMVDLLLLSPPWTHTLLEAGGVGVLLAGVYWIWTEECYKRNGW